MERENSPDNESFSDFEIGFANPDLKNVELKISPLLAHYYAVFYVLTGNIGRVLDFPDLVKVKFLRKLFETFLNGLFMMTLK
jgi:hypothetical protein